MTHLPTFTFNELSNFSHVFVIDRFNRILYMLKWLLSTLLLLLSLLSLFEMLLELLSLSGILLLLAKLRELRNRIFLHYSCVVIVLFNAVLCRSAFSTVSFGKLVFRLSVFFVLNKIFWIKDIINPYNCLLKNANFSIKIKQWINNIIYH